MMKTDLVIRSVYTYNSFRVLPKITGFLLNKRMIIHMVPRNTLHKGMVCM
jgi:hypothetical protein